MSQRHSSPLAVAAAPRLSSPCYCPPVLFARVRPPAQCRRGRGWSPQRVLSAAADKTVIEVSGPAHHRRPLYCALADNDRSLVGAAATAKPAKRRTLRNTRAIDTPETPEQRDSMDLVLVLNMKLQECLSKWLKADGWPALCKRHSYI